MKNFFINFLLCAAITLIAIGIHTTNLIIAGIGGFFAGIYNAIVYKQD